MNNIDTTQIVDPNVQQPFLGGSLAFLQNASKEMIAGVCGSLMGATNYGLSSSTGIVMIGLEFNSSLNTVFAGYIFFLGELYFFPGASGLNSYANTPVVILSTSNLSPDPVQFTDGVSRNVHKQRRLVVADQVSGTGLFDLANVIFANKEIESSTLTATFATSSSSDTAIPSATYTTPYYIAGIAKKFKFKFTGNVKLTTAVGTTEGFLIRIKNITTPTTYNATRGSFDPYGSVLDVFIPFSVSFNVSLPGSTTIIASIQRIGANNVEVHDGYWEVEQLN